MDFKEKYQEYLKSVEERLYNYIPQTEPLTINEPFNYIIRGGGKRIRPVLTMIGCGAAGGDPMEAIDCGAAIEILHNFTLVHDDIMDESPLRRGRETIHQKWDDATAILTGDVMVGYAYDLLPTNDKNKFAGKIFKTFNKGLIEVCEGQAYDMQFNCNKNVSVDDYILMIDKKTAFLLKTAVKIGAYYANANDKTVQILENVIHNFGIAFQFQDDMLDMTAEQEKLGKRIGQDIIEGKKTFLVIKSKELAKEKEDIDLVNKFYENDGLPADEVPKFIELVKKLGVFEISQKIIDQRLEMCYDDLNKLEQNYHVEMIKWLINSLNKRKF